MWGRLYFSKSGRPRFTLGELIARTPTCTCGACQKCRRREYMREYHRRNPEKNRAAVKKYKQTAKGVAARKRSDAARATTNQARMTEIKLDSGCVRCGYRDNAAALQFHHRDPATKVRGAMSAASSWPRVRREIEKCDVLCANCHAIEHYS